MRKLSVLALVVLACCASDVRAVDFQNVRGAYGLGGAKRPDNKILPGDVYQLFFDVTGLSIDPKNGFVKYSMTLEVHDPNGKQLIPEKDQKTDKGVIVGLGGNVVPEVALAVIGVDQAIGKYQMVVTVTDVATKASKKLTQSFEVLPKAFGFILVSAPSIGFVGQDNYATAFALVGMARDKKNWPKLTVKTRALDASGKPAAGDLVNKVPEDMPPNIQWDRLELVTLNSPYLLNRPGRFTIEIEATDDITKKTVKFSYGLTVVETGK